MIRAGGRLEGRPASVKKRKPMKHFIILFLTLLAVPAFAQSPSLRLNWNEELFQSKSLPTLQVVGNPMLRRGAAMHDAAFTALQNLNADIVRYVPWFPYPKLAVAELQPPTKTTTSWDFSLIDPMTIDFMEHTKGHSVMMNFSTIPQWMFRTEKPAAYPDDPNEVSWGYNAGTEFRDSTLKEVADYYVRLVSWYTKGGFTDELGKFHRSGHHYKFDYWEVLNEPDLEHSMTPQLYTRVYDAIVSALKPIMPGTKFVGLALAYEKPEWFEYFLNPANHKSGIPVDMISYHCYANANPMQDFSAYEFSVFDKADAFMHSVSYIEDIRKRLAPQTKTDLNELGTFVNDQMRNGKIDPLYWNLSAAVYAYFFIGFSGMGIDVIGESQLVGFPSQFPDVSMINYKNNKPNARYWVLKLILGNIKKGSVLIKTDIDGNDGAATAAQGFVSDGKKKILIINKRNKQIHMKLPAGFAGADMKVLDATTGDDEAKSSTVENDSLVLEPFSVNLITLNK